MYRLFGRLYELQPKKIVIHDLTLLERVSEDTYRVKIACGGGTYIRSIGRDMAEKLGTNAVMSSLRRTKSGYFTLENSLPFDLFLSDPTPEEMERYIIPTERTLPLERLTLQGKWESIFNGVAVETDAADGTYKLYRADGEFYGLAEVEKGFAKAKTKLC